MIQPHRHKTIMRYSNLSCAEMTLLGGGCDKAMPGIYTLNIFQSHIPSSLSVLTNINQLLQKAIFKY